MCLILLLLVANLIRRQALGREEGTNGIECARGSNVECNVTDKEIVEEAKEMEDKIGGVADDRNESEEENLEVETLVEHIELRDSSPGRKKELRAASEIEKSLVKQFAIRSKRKKIDLLPSVDNAEYAFFKETLTACPLL
ncbi:unnamed protein product [Arabis nemorensis]|uniref:Uncharacterized protein n=1 Tax=Arabis nemorensis TaxID=586526 RepID=A0A565AXS5_9BRAS|nr:unnamed protein product [Arabis nemorensis]